MQYKFVHHNNYVQNITAKGITHAVMTACAWLRLAGNHNGWIEITQTGNAGKDQRQNFVARCYWRQSNGHWVTTWTTKRPE